jgi:exodeoxyribonuclease V beta subunit
MNFIDKIDLKNNWVVEASAGTGKTYTIQQIVARLVKEGISLKKILIVTYTEKAAGELKDRIRKKLEEVLDSENNLEDNLDLFETALREVDNASIFTIHSFCQKALKEFAYDAGRPFDLNMIDDNEVLDVIDEWARDKWPHDPLYKMLIQHDTNVSDLKKELKNAIPLYYGKSADGEEIVEIDSAVIPNFPKWPEKFDDLLLVPEVKKNYDIIEANSGCTFNKDNESKTLGDFAAALKRWQGTSSELYIAGDFSDGKTPKSWPSEVYGAFKFFYKLKEEISKYPDAVKQKFIYSQIPLLFEEWQRIKKDHKSQSFNDMILSVHRAVMEKSLDGSDSNLCKKLRSEYTHAIIDEFQDTNQLQWDIFKKIFICDKHSVLVVGDPKQSIYSFQGADVNVYRSAKKEINNSKELNNNYRSTNEMIEACNRFFSCKSFFGDNSSFHKSEPPESVEQQKNAARFWNENLKEWTNAVPFWISEESLSEESFAETCVRKIIECCSYVKTSNGLHTRLQVFNKEKCKEWRDVTFKDFAILARTRSEMEPIEERMRKVGVPFTRYKDDHLFDGRECASWIALFKALNAPDFTSRNRRILNELLMTDFFAFSLEQVQSDSFDNPLCKEREMINNWKMLALHRRFAELQECIYSDTSVEERLKDLSKLQNLAKLRQIGSYAIDYLYDHGCSLNELIRKLVAMQNRQGDADDRDGNLIAKGTDFEAVQVMTIHASKGLEFPVVISVAGFKQIPTNRSGPFLYHDPNDPKKMRLGLGDDAKEARKKEELEEWSRLFYVDFTRASSVLMLPRYDKWYNKSGFKKHFKFLGESMKAFCVDENSAYYTVMQTENSWDFNTEKNLKKMVQEKILKPLSDREGKLIATPVSKEDQLVLIENLQKKVGELSIMQHSYSSLVGKVESSVSIDGSKALDKEGLSESYDIENELEKADAGIGEEELSIKYPRGSKLGNALHEVFELTTFHDFTVKYPDLELAQNSAELCDRVETAFRKQSLPIWNHQEDWTNHTIQILWNTLNATLPTIEGGRKLSDIDSKFKLTSIEPNCSKSEAQFNLNATAENNGEASEFLQNVCKGFIDLMFVRQDSSGENRYSILDWKSDVIPSGDYSSESVQKRVDEDYSVQRVLYCYCLIKWLKQFYSGLSETEIFDKHFGGIYYVFARGCKADSENGIYAHTWETYDALCESYEKVRTLMHKRRKKITGEINGEEQ